MCDLFGEFYVSEKHYLKRIILEIGRNSIFITAASFEVDGVSAGGYAADLVLAIPEGDSIEGVGCVVGGNEGGSGGREYLALDFRGDLVIEYNEVWFEQECPVPEKDGFS